jgi:hypothetical protein
MKGGKKNVGNSKAGKNTGTNSKLSEDMVLLNSFRKTKSKMLSHSMTQAALDTSVGKI